MAESLAIAALRAKAESTYEALPLTLESGSAVRLRSMIMLAEAEYATVEQLLEDQPGERGQPPPHSHRRDAAPVSPSRRRRCHP
ncbi:hypothetical protein ACFWY6_24245 [Streptomyces sp. NPDC059037]|uniref:hypothetical protein n=1 Tax=Streptomyces sp. NPDC059037 TaxID=3346710 RepID=UPI00369EDD09